VEPHKLWNEATAVKTYQSLSSEFAITGLTGIGLLGLLLSV
jgi:hypothetical protein